MTDILFTFRPLSPVTVAFGLPFISKFTYRLFGLPYFSCAVLFSCSSELCVVMASSDSRSILISSDGFSQLTFYPHFGYWFSLDCLSYYCPVTVAIGLPFISMSSDGFLRLTFYRSVQ